VYLLGIIAKKLTTDDLKVATETIVSVRKEQKPSKCKDLILTITNEVLKFVLGGKVQGQQQIECY
jgi:hypothetical protein